MVLSGDQILGNSFERSGSKAFYAYNPVTGEKMDPPYWDATTDEINKAIELAGKAFEIYRKKFPEEKANFLEKIAEEIINLDDLLIARCREETALPEARLISERGRTVNQIKMFAELLREGSWVGARIDTAIPERKPAPKPDIRQMQIPLGITGVFGASNFPLAFSVAGGDSISALAAGCPVVVKANPAHPGTSELIGRAIVNAVQKSGMPDGVFSLIHGQSNDVGITVVNHTLIKAIGFTGSFQGGKSLFDAAVRRDEPIPVYAEMGSTNPVFILPGAIHGQAERIAEELIGSITMGVGQFCTNPGLVIFQNSNDLNNFLNIIKDKFSRFPAGTMVAKKIKNNYELKIKKFTLFKEVEILAESDSSKNSCSCVSAVFKTSASDFMNNKELMDEVFGPSSLFVIANDGDEMKEVAAKLNGQLTASVFGADSGEIEDYSELLDILNQKVGRLIVNGFPTGVEVCHSMSHGGPFPATTDSRSTSVGTSAIKRFARPICFQNLPQSLLPQELKDNNPLKIWRLINGNWTKDKI